MQTPENFAASVLGCEAYRQPTWADGTPGRVWCRLHEGPSWPCPEQAALADRIRARDAEVREDALAGFEWVYETSFEDIGPCMAYEHTEHDGTEYVTSECYFPFAKRTRYLQGPSEEIPVAHGGMKESE